MASMNIQPWDSANTLFLLKVDSARFSYNHVWNSLIEGNSRSKLALTMFLLDSVEKI